MPEGLAIQQQAAQGKDYLGIAMGYVRDVVDGQVVAGAYERKACQRFLADLERQDDPDWPYYLDVDQGGLVCETVESFPHIEGKWAKQHQKLVLEGWQIFIILNVFGWLSKADGLRRFTEVYEAIARKNGKTSKLAAVALYLVGMDGEPGAQVVSAATKKDQAKIVFNLSREMAIRSAAFCRVFGIRVRIGTIGQPETASIFKPLDSVAGTQDGLNISAALNDELHAWRDRDMYDVIRTGTGSRDQPLIWNITTAGDDTGSLCYEREQYAKEVLDGVVDDDTLFAIVFSYDEKDDWTDPALLRKANPNLGVSVNTQTLTKELQQAVRQPSLRHSFKTKRLNIWQGATHAWMPVENWDAGARPGLTLDDFEGCQCVIGLDLASKKDLTAKAYIFWEGDAEPPLDNRTPIYVFIRYYLPEAAILASPVAQYKGWAETGEILVTGGNMTDLDRIEWGLVGTAQPDLLVGADELADIKPDVERFKVKEIAYDPHQATQLVTRCQKRILDLGLETEMVEVRPTVLNYSEPMKELEARVLDGLVRHDDHPVSKWCMTNVVVFQDLKDNIYPRKVDKNSPKKIDGAVAAISAINRWIALLVEEKPQVGAGVI